MIASALVKRSPQPGVGYTAAEAAVFLGWTEAALDAAAGKGKVPWTRVGRYRRFTAGNIAEILASGDVPAQPPPPPRQPRRRTPARSAGEARSGASPPLRARPEGARFPRKS